MGGQQRGTVYITTTTDTIQLSIFVSNRISLVGFILFGAKFVTFALTFS